MKVRKSLQASTCGPLGSGEVVPMVGAQRTAGQWSSPILVVLPGELRLLVWGQRIVVALVESYVQVSKTP